MSPSNLPFTDLPSPLLADEGKTIETVRSERGHFYDMLGTVVRVTRYTIEYTDGSSTTLDAAEQAHYASTSFIPGAPTRSGPGAFLDAVENYPPQTSAG